MLVGLPLQVLLPQRVISMLLPSSSSSCTLSVSHGKDEQLEATRTSTAVHVSQAGVLVKVFGSSHVYLDQVVARSSSLSIKALYSSMDCIREDE